MGKVAWVFKRKGLQRELQETRQHVADLERMQCGLSWKPNDLRRHEARVFSQNGEDGIIQEIFRRVGTTNKQFVEFGVQHGGECNCRRLVVEEDWKGLFMEMDDEDFKRLKQRYAGAEGVNCVQAQVTSAAIQDLLEKHQVPLCFDMLSIDIDGNDYWVWRAIQKWRPRVVVIEFNSHYRPPIHWVMQENDDFRWHGTSYFGASLSSLNRLAGWKKYKLVGTDSRGINAFFVR
ncbi:MAG: hypothetical protein N2C14_23170, partial [Planctomycetales bacterium]